MKKLMLVAAATVALAGPAFAQANTSGSSDSLTRTQGNNPHVGGDNQQSGGPRQSQATTGGVVTAPSGGVVTAPSTTGTVVAPGVGTAGTSPDPLSRTQGNDTRGTSATPSFQQGDNQQAGGPANELNTQTGIPGRR